MVTKQLAKAKTSNFSVYGKRDITHENKICSIVKQTLSIGNQSTKGPVAQEHLCLAKFEPQYSEEER